MFTTNNHPSNVDVLMTNVILVPVGIISRSTVAAKSSQFYYGIQEGTGGTTDEAESANKAAVALPLSPSRTAAYSWL